MKAWALSCGSNLCDEYVVLCENGESLYFEYFSDFCEYAKKNKLELVNQKLQVYPNGTEAFVGASDWIIEGKHVEKLCRDYSNKLLALNRPYSLEIDDGQVCMILDGNIPSVVPDFVNVISKEPSREALWSNSKTIKLGKYTFGLQDNALYDTNLNKIEFNDSLIYIGSRALGYGKFTEISIPDTVAYIGGEALAGNTMLTKIRFPKNLQHLGPNNLRQIPRIKEISFHSLNRVSLVPIRELIMNKPGLTLEIRGDSISDFESIDEYDYVVEDSNGRLVILDTLRINRKVLTSIQELDHYYWSKRTLEILEYKLAVIIKKLDVVDFD